MHTYVYLQRRNSIHTLARERAYAICEILLMHFSFFYFKLPKLPRVIGHFTVVYSVTQPMNSSEAAGDLGLIQSSLFLSCKSCCCDAN